ncbi:VanZ family protein [Paenibacillus alvei]
MVYRRKIFRGMCFCLFAVYIVILFYLLFFSGYRQAVKGTVAYNFIPFRSILADIGGLSSFNLGLWTNNLFGNILAFMPFGFFIPLLFANVRKLSSVIGCAFALSVSVELLQLVTRIGACDVDDVILNTLGGFCGYWLWKVMKRAF